VNIRRKIPVMARFVLVKLKLMKSYNTDIDNNNCRCITFSLISNYQIFQVIYEVTKNDFVIDISISVILCYWAKICRNTCVDDGVCNDCIV
jgi:hypothetical protein